MRVDCVFCRIITGDEDGSIVFQNDAVVAFLDVLPINAGHTLVVPRRHSPYLADLDPEHGTEMFRAGQRVAAALRASGLRCEGVNLILNDGAEAGQRVFHAHLHVIPRIIGDYSRGRTEGMVPTREELEAVAVELRRLL